MTEGVRPRRAPLPALEPWRAAVPQPAPILPTPAADPRRVATPDRALAARRAFAGDAAVRYQTLRANAALDASAMTLPQAVAVVDRNFALFAGDDDKFSQEDLRRLRDSSDPAVPREVKDAARFLLASPTAFRALDVGQGKGEVDGKISQADVTALGGRLAGEDYSRPTPGVTGRVDSRREVLAVLERYQPLADTAAGKGEADGQVSQEDVRVILADPHSPPELRQAAEYMRDYGFDTKEDGGILHAVSSPFGTVHDFLDRPELSDDRRRELEHAAEVDASEAAGEGERPLNRQQNAHHTNTPDELQAALEGDYQWLEGDIHRQSVVNVPGVEQPAVMGHDPWTTDGLTLRDWLDIGNASGRGLKLDIKQGAAVDSVIEEVERAGIPQDRLIFNADVLNGPGASGGAVREAVVGGVNVEQLQQIRAHFPEARISIGAHTGGGAQPPRYTEAQVDEMIRIAELVGGPVMFPLRAEYVTPDVVARLEAVGEVSIWNDPSTLPLTPAQAQAEADKFRAWGVTGIIDLRDSSQG